MTTKIYKRICAYLREKIKGTEWEGHVFAVGGCCRDIVLGQEIQDVDLAVDLPDGGVRFAEWLYKKKLSTMHPVIFARYGTAMLRLRAFPHDDLEIVQTRAEQYNDHNSRNPETAFGSLHDDCFRRDLTINALYFDITNGKMLDITGRSIQDIKNHVISTPMEPTATYEDDPIRIPRTVRFAGRLGWEIPSNIMEAMRTGVQRLNIIKGERLKGEFEKILNLENPSASLDLLRSTGVIDFMLPELTDISKEDWQRTLRMVDAAPTGDIMLRMAALLHTLADKGGSDRQDLIQALLRLKYHSPFIKEILILMAHMNDAKDWGPMAENMTDADLRAMQFAMAKKERLGQLLYLIQARNWSLPEGEQLEYQAAYIAQRSQQLEDAGQATFTYHLPFAERRIKKLLHIQPGPEVEDTLRYMMQLAFQKPGRSRAEFERLVVERTQQPDYVPATMSLPTPESKPGRRARRAQRTTNK